MFLYGTFWPWYFQNETRWNNQILYIEYYIGVKINILGFDENWNRKWDIENRKWDLKWVPQKQLKRYSSNSIYKFLSRCHPLRVESKLWWHVSGSSKVESQTVGSTPMRCSRSTLNPTCLPTYLPYLPAFSSALVIYCKKVKKNSA